MNPSTSTSTKDARDKKAVDPPLPQAPGGPKPDPTVDKAVDPPLPQAPGGPKPDPTVDNSDECDEGDEREECDICMADVDNPYNPCPYHTDYMQPGYSPEVST